jgi:hypothetical protein
MDLGDVRGDVYDIFMGNEQCRSLGGEDHRTEENKGCFDFNKLQFYAYADIYYIIIQVVVLWLFMNI